MWVIRLIKKLLPRTPYERESLLKGFLLFFMSMEVLLIAVGYLHYSRSLTDLKNSLFLELKNFSYTLEGEKFEMSLTSGEDLSFYELLEDRKGLYILVPVPGVEEEALRITYPRESFERDLSDLKKETFALVGISTSVLFILSVLFSLYTLHPLRKALDMIEEVTRDIIHDLNTPLMSLMVNLKMIAKKYEGEEIKRAQMALKQINSLRENLRPLLAKVELRRDKVNLGEIVSQEVESLKALYPDIEVRAKLRPVEVVADRDAVRRVVENLIGNAFKHNVPGGWVKVKLTQTLFVVENSSPPLKNPSRVFERHYRESQRGMGLGLSIAKKLAREMGWDISVRYEGGVFRAEVTLK